MEDLLEALEALIIVSRRNYDATMLLLYKEDEDLARRLDALHEQGGTLMPDILLGNND